MSKISVFDQKWLDLVFEGRNKTYGAYQLRQQDSKTTLLALFSGIALMGALVGIPAIIDIFKPEVAVINEPEVLPPITDEVVPVELEKKAAPVVGEKPAAAPKQQENTIRHTAIVATSASVKTDIPTTAQVIQTNAGTTTTQGGGEGIDIGPVSSNGAEQGTGTGENSNTGSGPENAVILAAVDQAPAFPGGINKFLELVGNKFKTPDIDRETTVKVLVSFIVEKDGSITAIKVLRDPGYGLGKEAVRVLNAINTKWTPGKIKGKPVRTAYSLPIVIKVN